MWRKVGPVAIYSIIQVKHESAPEYIIIQINQKLVWSGSHQSAPMLVSVPEANT